MTTDVFIPIEKESIPYRFDMEFGSDTYTFEVNYNSTFDFFTFDLYKGDDPIAFGEKVVHGVPLFDRYPDALPVQIIPLDAAGQENRVTWDNLGELVKLWVVEP